MKEISTFLKKWWDKFYYFFPIQLLLLHIKKHQFLLAIWVLLYCFITGIVASSFGLNSLLLDPEYLGQIGYLSFTITGIGFGAFIVGWNLVVYMLHSHRFQFLASFHSPMLIFFINNAIVPVTLLIVYIRELISFQRTAQFATNKEIAIDIVGFLGGIFLMLLLAGIYFQVTNRSKLKTIDAKVYKQIYRNDELDINSRNRVDYFINRFFKIKHTKQVDHYLEEGFSAVVFRRQHINTFIGQLLVFLAILGLGFLMENPIFQIPTAAALLLFCSLLVTFAGALIFWAGGWGTSAIVGILALVNYFSSYDFLGYQSKIYGLDYSSNTPYNYETFNELSSNEKISRDTRNMLSILEKWKRKNTILNKKPKLVFLNVSGGGLRSAMFVTAVLQNIDNTLQKPILDKTFLISGASGGMFGSTFYREVFLQKKLGNILPFKDSIYSNIISQDLLNPMVVSLLSNDLFLPIHHFTLDSMRYHIDRGYMLERQLNINTGGLFNKRLYDYYDDEKKAYIPLLIFHTNILNDSRRYFISTQPVSFLMRPVGKFATNKDLGIDAIDYCALFANRKAINSKIASIARVNATFPLILPNSILPTNPATYVMDGGALDNFGSETTFRFLQTFKDWINENTDGVVIIQIRDTEKNKEIFEYKKRSLLTQVAAPFGTVYANMEHMQDFTIDQKLGYMNEVLKGKIQFITFEYTPEKKEEKAALSFHLTEKEKQNIKTAVFLPRNQKALQLTKELLDY